MLNHICIDAVCNVRSYIKVPVSLFYSPHCFPFEECNHASHLLLNELDFLIPSLCMGPGFHPLASETYTSKAQQNNITLVYMLTVIKLFGTQRFQLLW